MMMNLSDWGKRSAKRPSSSRSACLVVCCVIALVCYTWYTAHNNAVTSHSIGDTSSRRFLQCSRPCEKDTAVIPRRLHHIFLDGEAAYWRNATVGDGFTPNFYPRTKGSGEKNATFRHEWKTGCQRLMPDWRYRFWDMEAAVKLIKEQYAWFLPTFKGYNSVVAKGDALRPIILHAFGGMYLDLDVECYRSADEFLAGHDLVLQAEEPNVAALINAVMASTAQHPFWMTVLDLMQERAAAAHNVLYATGPQVISEAYKVYRETKGGPLKDARVRDGGRLTPHVYQLGEFYLPCNWLSQELCTEVDNANPKPANLAGFHHWAGSWKSMKAWDNDLILESRVRPDPTSA